MRRNFPTELVKFESRYTEEQEKLDAPLAQLLDGYPSEPNFPCEHVWEHGSNAIFATIITPRARPSR